MKSIYKIFILSILALSGCGPLTSEDASSLSENDSRRILTYQRRGEAKYHLKFEVSNSGKTAKITTNEIAYAGRHAMRFILNETINWPLINGQEIPAIWDVGSTTGNCHFQVKLTVTRVGQINALDPYAFTANWEIPAYVSPACASSGLRTVSRNYFLN